MSKWHGQRPGWASQLQPHVVLVEDLKEGTLRELGTPPSHQPFAIRLEAIASRFIASRLQAIDMRLEAIAIRLEAIALPLALTPVFHEDPHGNRTGALSPAAQRAPMAATGV